MTSGKAMIDVQLLDRPVAYVSLERFPTAAGGECIFLGRTRLERHPKHGWLRRLSYEAYRPMAEQVMRGLATHAIERFGCSFVRLHHSISEVPPGDASVFVQVLCAHRAAAFDACRFLIDELKTQAPIWKREEWEDGSTWSQGAPVTTKA